MSKKVISGIQQIGIGVPDAHKAWKWYRDHFSMDIEVFEDKADADLMTKHTGDKVLSRHAILALNMQGGGGFEIWQQTKNKAQKPSFDLSLGDLGIFSCKIKCHNANEFHDYCIDKGLDVLSDVSAIGPMDRNTFYLRDPYGNIFQAVESKEWYKNEGRYTGGTYGATIGVSDIDTALTLYKDILDHNDVLYDLTGKFEDFASLPGGEGNFRRVLLKNDKPRKGAFGKLLSSSEIELIQCLDKNDRPHIFKDRVWGDLGFIHLCFDTRGMDHLKKECEEKGMAFTVDSADSFDMGVAAGRFSYVQDDDGTLIEFVETHKLPIFKKLGWYMNLRNRHPEKHLPDWMVNTLSWKRFKN